MKSGHNDMFKNSPQAQNKQANNTHKTAAGMFGQFAFARGMQQVSNQVNQTKKRVVLVAALWVLLLVLGVVAAATLIAVLFFMILPETLAVILTTVLAVMLGISFWYIYSTVKTVFGRRR